MALETGEKREETLGAALTARSGETAVTAGAARAKALVEAAYLVAINRPRDIQEAEKEILPLCNDPDFAEEARWNRIVGRKWNEKTGEWEDEWGEGFSIRFAEVAIQAMGNITPTSEVIFEDERMRIIRISVTDLEKNVIYSKDVTLAKTKERLKLRKGDIALSERTNSRDQKVYEVAATEFEMANKQARAESLAMRTNGLRLIPAHIKSKAWKAITKTIEDSSLVTPESIQKVVGAFTADDIGAKPEEIEGLLNHPIAQMTMQEYLRLRGLYQAIRDGATTWQETINAKVEVKPAPETGTLNMDDLKPGEESEHTPVNEPLFKPDKPKMSVLDRLNVYCEENEFGENASEALFAAVKKQFGKAVNDLPDSLVPDVEAWLKKYRSK